MRILALSLLSLSLQAAPATVVQVGNETLSQSTAPGHYPVQWPAGPKPGSVPAWAAPGRIRFTRWDGGRLETGKATLSGWPGFNPPDPDRVYVMTNWYRPETVRFLREANFNLIWVTFSNGFSNQAEAGNQAELRTYIKECHRSGIRVMAYESITNLFWEDMFQRVPESRDWLIFDKNGKPVPYGAGDYAKLGRVTRYLADLRKPGWRDYLRRRIDLAIDAGADGVMYDNNASDHLLEVYRDIYVYATSRKKDFLLMGNFHNKTYVYNRLINCITTEDGFEPGIYAEANIARLEANQKTYYGSSHDLLSIEDGLLVNNGGLYRIHQTLSEGWKPTMIETGPRELGARETDVMSGERHQLAMAECRMFGISMEPEPEGAFAEGLQAGDPVVRRVWDAIGVYNRFFADNEDYYTNARSVARIAVVLDDRSVDVPLLNALAARRVLYDVLYECDLTREKLVPYSVVAVLTAATFRDTAVSALEDFVGRGGSLFAIGESAKLDETGHPRTSPAVFSRGRFHETLPPIDELAKALIAAAPPQLSLEAPPSILANVLAQSEGGRTRLVVHLLNYSPRAAQGVKVRLPGKFEGLRLLSPDKNSQPARLLYSTEKETAVEVPEVAIYSMLVFEP
jgi:hypothetical protein